ncbi:MAG: hypothetical protein IJV36_00610 [Prevotella sp.]|nr:hypothetical protein [Prevotella sp.]
MNDIQKKDDALQLVMQRRKERRPKVELPEGLEDRVMERISASGTKSTNKAKVARLWLFLAIGAAAVVTGIIFLVEGLKPAEDVLQNVVTKVEDAHSPIAHETEKELPQMAEVRTQAAPRKRPSCKVRKEVLADNAIAKTEDDVCISCELDAMSDELTAMINEFENQ